MSAEQSGRYRDQMQRDGLPIAVDHDKGDETIQVGVQTHDDDGNRLHTWELRVCGIVQAYGVAGYGADALRQAAEALDRRSEEATGR